MNNTALRSISVFAQLLSVFPFVVLCEGVGFGRYVWWHYIAFFLVYAVFYAWGKLCASWALNPGHSRTFKPKAIFLSRAAVIVPIIAYVLVCATFEFSSALYLYALPAAIIMFSGGHRTAGKEYSDIFTRGWFALFFVSAVISSVIIWFTKKEELTVWGNFQLCFAFGLLIVISAVLTNQTNIDTCTHQRDSQRASLPKGLRGYNSGLVMGVAGATVALCLFAIPMAQFFVFLIKTAIGWIIELIRSLSPDYELNYDIDSEGGSGLNVNINDNSAAEIISALLFVSLIVVIIVFRKKIAAFFRDMIAPLFRMKEESDNAGYYDEVSEIEGFARSGISRRKRQQMMYKDFRKEKDKVTKYRLGYNYMLLLLKDTAFAPVYTDNTDIHRYKGENGLHNDDVKEIVSVYNKVRYGGYVPTDDDIAFAEEFIEKIRR